MIKVVNGDLLRATENIIGHQVNSRGVMGGGIARQIRDKYPNVYEEYKKVCNDVKNPRELLGECLFTTDEDVIVANIFSQLNYGRDKNIVYTDYDALRTGLSFLKTIASKCNYSIALPYNIGCGLANGDWNIVYKIIEEVFCDYDVTLYKL